MSGNIGSTCEGSLSLGFLGETSKRCFLEPGNSWWLCMAGVFLTLHGAQAQNHLYMWVLSSASILLLATRAREPANLHKMPHIVMGHSHGCLFLPRALIIRHPTHPPQPTPIQPPARRPLKRKSMTGVQRLQNGRGTKHNPHSHRDRARSGWASTKGDPSDPTKFPSLSH